MKTFCKKTPLAIIVFSGYLLFPFVAFANTDVTLFNASGGAGGSPFVDMAVRGGRIAAVTVRSGRFIDSIQLTYRYGNKRVVGIAHGGRGGRPNTFRLSPGEVITELGGRSGKFVDSLYIKTSMNRKKEWGGKGGGRVYRFTGSRQSPITGIWGRSGSLLDAIGAVKAKKGGQTIKTRGLSRFEREMNTQGGNNAKSDSIQRLQFPGPAANANILGSWLETHNAKLENIIRTLSSPNEFRAYSKGESNTCRSSLYCQIAYRREAISFVTGAK